MSIVTKFTGLDQAIQSAVLIGGIVVVLAAGGFSFYQYAQRAAAEEKLATLEKKHELLVEKSGRCEMEGKGLQIALAEVNGQVAAMKEAETERLKAAEAAMLRAAAAAKAGYAKAEEIARSGMLDADECKSMKMRADRSVREFLGGKQ